MEIEKLSTQKNYKLQPILITLQTIFWSYLKCDVISNIIIFITVLASFSASVLLNLGLFESFYLSNYKPIFFLKKQGLWLSKSIISVKIYVTVSTSYFLIKPLLSAALSFHYVHIRFRTFRIAIYSNQTEITIIIYIIPEANKTGFWLSTGQYKSCENDRWVLKISVLPG